MNFLHYQGRRKIWIKYNIFSLQRTHNVITAFLLCPHNVRAAFISRLKRSYSAHNIASMHIDGKLSALKNASCLFSFKNSMLVQHSFANINLFRLFEAICHQVTQDLRTYFKYCTSNYVFNMTLIFVSI